MLRLARTCAAALAAVCIVVFLVRNVVLGIDVETGSQPLFLVSTLVLVGAAAVLDLVFADALADRRQPANDSRAARRDAI